MTRHCGFLIAALLLAFAFAPTQAALVQRIQQVTNDVTSTPLGIAVDPLGSGGLYIADAGKFRVKLVATAPFSVNSPVPSSIATYAGTGKIGSTGDGGPATLAELAYPTSVTVDLSGNVYICDLDNNRVRMVSTVSNVRKISTVAGSGGEGKYGGDGGPATLASLNSPYSVAVDGSGNMYVSDRDSHRVRYVNPATGLISTVVGTGVAGTGGDGGAGTSAQLSSPQGLALAANLDLYIADTGNHRIRKYAFATRLLTTVAGTGQPAFSGDGGLAVAAALSRPTSVAVATTGTADTVYIADLANLRVRVVTGGVITTLAGYGTTGTTGDEGPATAALLQYPVAVAVDSLTGAVYIADGGAIRRVVVVEQAAASTVQASADLRYLAALAAIVPIIAVG